MQKVFSHLQRHQGHRALPDAQAKGTRTHGGDAFGLWLSSSGDRGGLLPRRADGGALGEGGRDTLPASSRARGRGRSGRVGAGTSRRVAGEGYGRGDVVGRGFGGRKPAMVGRGGERERGPRPD